MKRELRIVVEQRLKVTKSGEPGEWTFVTHLNLETEHDGFVGDLVDASTELLLDEPVSPKARAAYPDVSLVFTVPTDTYIETVCKWVLAKGEDTLTSEVLLDLGAQVLMTRAARYRQSGGEMRLLFTVNNLETPS